MYFIRSLFRGAGCRKLLPAVLLQVTFFGNASTAAILASDGSQPDVQAKIDRAVDGDVVTIPSGTFVWSKGVTIAGKAVHLKGAGAGRIVARSATPNSIGTGTKTFSLLTENVSSIENLKTALLPGRDVTIWRTGGAIAGGSPTGAVPWMRGSIANLSGALLTVNTTSGSGTGTHPLWIIGTDAASTIQLNAASTSALTVSENSNQSVEISGVRFEHQPTLVATIDTAANFIRLERANNGLPVLIHDCTFLKYTYGDQIYAHSNRGVIWNCSFVSLPFSGNALAIHLAPHTETSSWTSPSTMGTADATGKSNLYVEDCDFHAWLNATDFDDNARAVMRYCLFNNAAVGTHGADSSNFGQRHFEVYGSDFVRNDYNDGQTINVNWFFLIRGGTAVITDNWIPALAGQDYPSRSQIKLCLWNLQFNGGPNPLWGKNIIDSQYPSPRQVGTGYVSGNGKDGRGRSTDSISYVGDSEPIYVWNNRGTFDCSLSAFGPQQAGEDSVTDYIKPGRDYFIDGTPKPGWTKPIGTHPASYPHALRGAPRFVQISVAQ